MYINTASAEPNIEITSPSSNDILYVGDSITITWSSSDLDSNYVKIELYKNGIWEQNIDAFHYNYGYKSWTVSDTLNEDDDYQIKIIDYYNSSIYDFTGYFSIEFPRSISVSNPSSSTTWFKNEGNYISWNSEYAGDYVQIFLYKDNSLDRTISSYTNNDGYHYWSVPSNLEIGSDYQIKISSYDYDNVEDYSSDFTIDERTITITSPDQNSTWYKREEYKIKWTSRNAGNSVNIKLYENGAYKSTISSYENNDGEYSWTVYSSLTDTSTYKIKIESASSSFSVSDYSEDFSISQRSLTFTTTFSGKTWFFNESHIIEWTSENAGNYVDITCYKNNVYCGKLAEGIANSGSYTWNIPNIFQPSDGYSILIESTEYSYVKDESEQFSIGGREIEIEKPSKNEILYIGEEFAIKWDSNNAGEKIDIILYKNNEKVMTIASNVDGSDGLYNWEIPEDISEGADYQIKIASSSFSNVSTVSEKFSVEKTLMQKFSTPLMIIIGTIVLIACIFGLISFFKRRETKFSKDEKTSKINYNTVQEKGIIKTDNSQKEYDKIWENKKF